MSMQKPSVFNASQNPEAMPAKQYHLKLPQQIYSSPSHTAKNARTQKITSAIAICHFLLNGTKCVTLYKKNIQPPKKTQDIKIQN